VCFNLIEGFESYFGGVRDPYRQYIMSFPKIKNPKTKKVLLEQIQIWNNRKKDLIKEKYI
jgi:hypothetical protein